MAHSTDVDDFIRPFIAPPGRAVHLARDFDPRATGPFADQEAAKGLLADGVQLLAAYQDKLYAQNIHALLVVIQAMDAAGKDSTIKHVMSGINPQGCQVFSFKVPSQEELDHDYLWRFNRALPERGRIGIFNRSYYEDVLVVRVHPAILAGNKLPAAEKNDGIWQRRFEQINHFEAYLEANGIHVLKFFLNVSKAEQRKRFLARIDEPDKNWKFAAGDVTERAYWDDYMHAYQEVLRHTSTEVAPWYVIPADHKWFMRLAVVAVMNRKMQQLAPSYPETTEAHRLELQTARAALLAEDGPDAPTPPAA
jgi:PPK2 family polyphosphate:nucleotide phosphotransferase